MESFIFVGTYLSWIEKTLYKKVYLISFSGRSSILVDSNESTLNANKSGSKGTAQTATICPQQYTRESSHLSISWSESSRPSTPANLFLAKADK